MADRIPELDEIVGSPAVSAPEEIAGAVEERFQALFGLASHGDPAARRELVRLRLAYLNWAYSGLRTTQRAAKPSLP